MSEQVEVLVQDRRERMKPLAQVGEPDSRWCHRVVFDTAGTTRTMTIADHYGQLEDLVIHEGVPEDIWQHFETARVVYLYSWHAYRLVHVADLHALASLEFALREKRGPDSKVRGLGRLLGLAVKDRLVWDRGMRQWQRHEAAREREHQREAEWPEEFRKLFGRDDSFAPAPVDSQRYVNNLGRFLPKFRNELAHGSFMLMPQGTEILEICCDLINQLWPSPGSGATGPGAPG